MAETRQRLGVGGILADEELAGMAQEAYEQFIHTVKPLISRVEAAWEQFPKQFLNEVRSFNDHMARCFTLSEDREQAKKQLEKANRHLARIMLDCYKALLIKSHENVQAILVNYRDVDMSTIDNGRFVSKYLNLLSEAENLKLLAKEQEILEQSDAEKYQHYSNACAAYNTLHKFLVDHTTYFDWERATRIRKKKQERNKQIINYLIVIGSTVIGAVIGAAIHALLG